MVMRRETEGLRRETVLVRAQTVLMGRDLVKGRKACSQRDRAYDTSDDSSP